MFSVNQMAIYHSLLETYNMKRKSASEQIKLKWEDTKVNTCSMSFRSSTNNYVMIPEKPAKSVQDLLTLVLNSSIFYLVKSRNA